MTSTCPHDGLIWLVIDGVFRVCCEACHTPMVLRL